MNKMIPNFNRSDDQSRPGPAQKTEDIMSKAKGKLSGSLPGRMSLFLSIGMLAMLVLLTVTSRRAQGAPGRVTIINLRSDAVFVAYGIDQWGDNGDLAFVPDRWLDINCWYRIDPGESRDFPANAWVYVEQDGNRIYWSDRDEKIGAVHPTSRCGNNLRVRYNYYTGDPDQSTEMDLARLTGQGYVRRTFQKFAAGRYWIRGDGYDLRSRRFSFDYGSHSSVTHRHCFEVPGTVVDYALSVQRRHGPRDSWNQNGDELCLSVTTQGNQPYLGAPVERGYFAGSVTVYYTVRQRSSSDNIAAISLQAGFAPDPHRTPVAAGGNRSASSLRSGCAGYIGMEPTRQLNWSGASGEIRIYVTSTADTTLLIRDPSGNYHCNDDWTSGDTDPMLRFNNPRAGSYTIWVGKYSRGTANGVLYISERNLNPARPN